MRGRHLRINNYYDTVNFFNRAMLLLLLLLLLLLPPCICVSRSINN